MASQANSQRTDFSLDIVGRYISNGLDEAYRSADPNPRFDRSLPRPDARPFDMIVIGGGTFGSVLATRLFWNDKTHGHRILVLEAGPVSIPEHQQNLPQISPGEVWGVPWDSDSPQSWNRQFPGLAFTVGGRSIFWGGWSPYFIDSEWPSPPWPQSVKDDLSAPGPQNGNEAYLDQSARQIGTSKSNDFISEKLHEELQDRLFKGLKKRPAKSATVLTGNRGSLAKLEDLEAPLAVESVASRPGFFPFNKFSAVPLLIRSARTAFEESNGDDVRKRLMVVPHCHVIRLEMNGRRVARIHTNQGAIDVPQPSPDRFEGGRVFLALGTIENTRMALNTFTNHALIGTNLMAHLRSNLTLRIPRASFGAALDPNLHPELKDLTVSALFVKGIQKYKDGSRGHFHLQITASGVGDLEVNSEAELFKKIPDIEGLDNFRGNTDQWIVITIRGIGEMAGSARDPQSAEPRNRITVSGNRANFDYEASRALVSLEPSQKDLDLWKAMDDASDEVARIFAGEGPIEFLSLPNRPAPAVWQKNPPTTNNRRDTLSSTHHEGGTLWMGDPGTSVTDEWGRFHDADNLYVAGPALLPTLGSPNPMLSGVALARRTADHLVPPPQAAPLEAGFRYLFDGRQGSFKRWQTVGQGTFTLIDGAIVTYPGGDLGLFYYPEAFGDFVLRLQFRIESVDDNSGVFVRSWRPKLPVPRRDNPAVADVYGNPAYVPVDTGFEIQIDELARGNRSKGEADGMDRKRTGAIYDIPTTPGGIQQNYRSGPAVLPGEWYDYEIKVEKSAAGDIYTVRLKHQQWPESAFQQTTSYTNTDAYRGKSVAVDANSGFIGLQSHTGRVAFRNIRIRPL